MAGLIFIIVVLIFLALENADPTNVLILISFVIGCVIGAYVASSFAGMIGVGFLGVLSAFAIAAVARAFLRVFDRTSNTVLILLSCTAPIWVVGSLYLLVWLYGRA
jgi:hypothetical protein